MVGSFFVLFPFSSTHFMLSGDCRSEAEQHTAAGGSGAPPVTGAKRAMPLCGSGKKGNEDGCAAK